MMHCRTQEVHSACCADPTNCPVRDNDARLLSEYLDLPCLAVVARKETQPHKSATSNVRWYFHSFSRVATMRCRRVART